MQAEAHKKVLKQTKGRDDGGLWDVGGGDGYLVVSLDEVDLAEDGASVQAIGEVLHVWQGVPVWRCDGVESPQCGQEPSFLGTMCSRDAQAELDLRMIPDTSSFLNSALAMRSLSGARRSTLANTGRWPPVSMTCSMPCVGVGVSVSDLIIDWYFAMSRLTGSGMLMLTSCSGVDVAMSAAALRGFLTSFVGAAGAVAGAASDLGRDLTSCFGGLLAPAAKMAEMGLPALSNT